MANEMRLIDANILEERVNQEPTDGMFTHEIIAAIKEQPTVDAAPVVHGRWDMDEFGVFCPVCKEYAIENERTNYCPNCGAKMDLEA